MNVSDLHLHDLGRTHPVEAARVRVFVERYGGWLSGVEDNADGTTQQENYGHVVLRLRGGPGSDRWPPDDVVQLVAAFVSVVAPVQRVEFVGSTRTWDPGIGVWF
jgi:hypothetical protein